MLQQVTKQTTAYVVFASSDRLQGRVSPEMQQAWQVAVLLSRPGTELGEAMLMQSSTHEYLAVVPQPTVDQQREIVRWQRRGTFGQPLIQWQERAASMLAEQCQQAGVELLTVPLAWEPLFAAYPQVGIRVVAEPIAGDSRGWQLSGGYQLYSLRQGEELPVEVLYCGRGRGGVVPEQPSKYGCFGNPVKVSRRLMEAAVGEEHPCPECQQLHFSGGETLDCYRIYLRRRLNYDVAFRAAFVRVMQRYTQLGCYCRSGLCHTSVMAEVWRNYRRRLAVK